MYAALRVQVVTALQIKGGVVCRTIPGDPQCSLRFTVRLLLLLLRSACKDAY